MNQTLCCGWGSDTHSGVGDSWGTPGWLSQAGALSWPKANKTSVGSGAASCGWHGQWWPSSDTMKSCSIPGEGKAHGPKDSSQELWLGAPIPAASALTRGQRSFYFNSYFQMPLGSPAPALRKEAEPSRAGSRHCHGAELCHLPALSPPLPPTAPPSAADG